MKKWRYLLLLTGCFLINGCYQRHFEDGFSVVFHANAFDLKANECYELDPIQFSDLIYSICTQVEKIESSEIKKRIKEELKLEKHLIINLRYAVFIDDVPARIEVTSDGYLRDRNEYFLLSKTQYDQLTDFIENSATCE